MKLNFFIDFALFLVMGLMAAIGFKLAFIVATAVASVTQFGRVVPVHRSMPLYGVRENPNFDALPGIQAAKRDNDLT